MVFQEVVGGTAILCYILAVVFDNAGFGALALGLTIYAIETGMMVG